MDNQLKIELIESLRSLDNSVVESDGISLLDKYIETASYALEFHDITSRLLPYATEKLAALLTNVIGKDQEAPEGLNYCFAGGTVNRTMKDTYSRGEYLIADEWVYEGEYEKFAHLLNYAVDNGLIENGCYSIGAFKMPLAVISCARSTMLCICTYSRYDKTALKNISNFFTDEGALPDSLADVVMY